MGWGGGSGNPNFFLRISFRSGRSMVGDKSNDQKFHRINGFLSLQLELRMEVGLRLRLTKNPPYFYWAPVIRISCPWNSKLSQSNQGRYYQRYKDLMLKSWEFRRTKKKGWKSIFFFNLCFDTAFLLLEQRIQLYRAIFFYCIFFGDHHIFFAKKDKDYSELISLQRFFNMRKTNFWFVLPQVLLIKNIQFYSLWDHKTKNN